MTALFNIVFGIFLPLKKIAYNMGFINVYNYNTLNITKGLIIGYINKNKAIP